MNGTNIGACGWYHVTHCRPTKSGKMITIYEDDCKNQLQNDGQFTILDIAFRAGTAPTNWFIGLLKNTLTVAPATSVTLATLTTTTYELTNASDAGYSARQQVNRDSTASGWPTLAVNGTGEQITSKTVTWTASGNWADTVRWMFLTTITTVGDTTGKFISISQLTADRTLLNGDTLNITYNLKLT